MDDHKLTQEDEQRVTAETALDIWRNTVRTLENAAPEIAARVNHVGTALGALWQQAQATGDQSAMTRIEESWGHVEQVATQAVMLDGGLAAAKTVVGALKEELDRAETELAELERAVEAVDRRHPLVDDLIQDVAQDIADEAMWEAEDYVAEGMREDLYFQIVRETGVRDWMAINNLVDWLQGDGMDGTDEQKALLTGLVNSFVRKEG